VGGFIPWERFAVGAFTALVFFAWLRILDEHKDADVDRLYRPELPVPRGLISLGELRQTGLVLLVAAVVLNLLVAPRLLWACLAVAAYAALMTREFFVGEWLRAQPALYLLSHMLILPLIDAYTTGLDWFAEGAAPPRALWFFLTVTYLNGIVIEIGRKIRSPDAEREGVDTYTRVWGVTAAPSIWLATLAATAALAWMAVRHIGAGTGTLAVLLGCAVVASMPAVSFLRTRSAKSSRAVEAASGVWTIAMYLLLGAGQWILRRGFGG
jgi:4-hydroxybenzoate polyprenyltransferase